MQAVRKTFAFDSMVMDIRSGFNEIILLFNIDNYETKSMMFS